MLDHLIPNALPPVRWDKNEHNARQLDFAFRKIRKFDPTKDLSGNMKLAFIWTYR